MKLDQLCFYAEYHWQSEEIKSVLGLQHASWIVDNVTMQNRFPEYNPDEWYESIAELQFCENLGIQFEIMRFTQGPHYNAFRDKQKYFIGHIGLHLEENTDWPPMTGAVLMQESKTIAHTAPAFHDPKSSQYGRRYNYRIYKMPHSDDIFIKLIKRIHPQSQLGHKPIAWAG
jgi:hypothetical protein